MNDKEKIEALRTILIRHEISINQNDGGERPFNETGEVLEALWFLVNDNKDRLIQVGWLER